MADNRLVDFSVIDDDVEQLEFGDSYIPPTTTDSLEQITDEDRQKAAEEGRAESKAEKQARELKEKTQKEEIEAKKKADEFILGGPDDKGKHKTDSEESLDDIPKTTLEKKEGEDDNLEGIAAFAKELYDIDFFTKDEEDEKIPTTPDELLEKLDSEAENRADAKVDAFASRFGEDYKEVFKAIFVDGADPKEYFSKFQDVQSWEALDMKDESNQEKVVRTSLKNQGWDQEDIDDKVKSMKLNSELENDALRYHKALVRTEKENLTKIQKESQDKLRQKQTKEEHYKNSVNTILNTSLKAKELGGVPINKDQALQLRDDVTAPAYKLPSGELITKYDAAILELNNPQNYATKILLGHILDLGKFKPGELLKLNLGSLVAAKKSNDTKTLFNKLVTHKANTTSTKDNGSKTSLSSFDDIEI